jgi:hypothetical protein
LDRHILIDSWTKAVRPYPENPVQLILALT